MEQPKRQIAYLYKSLILLFFGVVTVSFFTNHASMSMDPPNRYLVAKSMVDHGDLMIRPLAGEPLPPATYRGKDGNYYSFYGIGQPLIFAGPYYICRYGLGIESDKLIRSIIALTMFPPVLGLIAVFFFLLLREFGFSPRRCWTGAVLVVFATGLWQGSKECQEECHIALLFIIGVWALRRYQVNNSRTALAGGAAAMAYAFLMRIDTVFTIAGWLALAFYFIYQQNHRPGEQTEAKRKKLLPYILVVALMLPALLVHCYITYRHFGSFISGPHNTFSLSYLPRGLAGMLFSPGKSIFIYNPIMILAVVGMASFWRLQRAWAMLVLFSLVAGLLLHSAVFSWHGGCCWGPRYFERNIPLAFLAVAFFGLYQTQPGRSRRWSMIILAGASLLVQIAAVSLHHNRELLEMQQAYGHWDIESEQFSFFEPQANFLVIRLENLHRSISEMINGKIGPWPKQSQLTASIDEQLQAPVLHYPAFWPYHLTYYLPTVKPDWALSTGAATIILLMGISAGIMLLYGSRRVCTPPN